MTRDRLTVITELGYRMISKRSKAENARSCRVGALHEPPDERIDEARDGPDERQDERREAA